MAKRSWTAKLAQFNTFKMQLKTTVARRPFLDNPVGLPGSNTYTLLAE